MRIVFLFAALTLCGCQSAPDTKKIAIVGAKLIDGKGGAPVEHSIILIEGATIVKAGPQTSVPLPKDAEIVDGMGKTIEPIATGSVIDAGQPATFEFDRRIMRDGKWQN